MADIPSTFSRIQLHNRLNRPVWLGFKRVCQDDRELVFLCGGPEGAAQINKNFETFVGQIVREFHMNPAEVDFIELRGSEDEQHWYRWHAKWVGSAPMEAHAELVVGESRRRYLTQALNCAVEAA